MGWRRTVLCHAVPSHQGHTQLGMGTRGRVLPLSRGRTDGVAKQLPGGGEAGTKRELLGPLSLHPFRNPPGVCLPGHGGGYRVTHRVPPAVATVPPWGCRRAAGLQGANPRRRQLWGYVGVLPPIAVTTVALPGGVRSGSRLLRLPGCSRWGQGRRALAGRVLGTQRAGGTTALPRAGATSHPALPRHLPRLASPAGPVPGLAGGAGGRQLPRPAWPCPPGGPGPREGARTGVGGGPAPIPGPFPRYDGVQRAGMRRAGVGHPTPGDVPPSEGTPGRDTTGGGDTHGPVCPGAAGALGWYGGAAWVRRGTGCEGVTGV